VRLVKEKYQLTSIPKIYSLFTPERPGQEVSVKIKAPVPMVVAVLPSNIADQLYDKPDKLSSLQQKVITGEEVTFTADIVTALELDKVIVVAAEFEEHGGRPGYYDYRLTLRESPPLPPPAELTSPGGLGDLGMGDLGFDTDLLGDIAGMAGDLQNAIETVSGALDTLGALASLGDLGLNNPLSPMVDEAGKVGSSGSGATGAAGKLADLLGGTG
jgi:hypothetical protein